jgi:hypothetical protein
MILGNRHPRRIVRRTSFGRAVACALFASGMFACRQAYRPVPAATLDSGSEREYRKLLVVTRDGYQMELVHAFIRPDSVVGFTPDRDNRRLAFAHDNIARIERAEWSVKGEHPPSPPDSSTDFGRSIICTLFSNGPCPPPPQKELPRTP